MIAAYTQIIKDNIEYEALKLDMGYQGALIDEIVELLLETVSVKREHIRISGADYPYQLVKGKLLKLDYSRIRYVIIGGLIGGLVAYIPSVHGSSDNHQLYSVIIKMWIKL